MSLNLKKLKALRKIYAKIEASSLPTPKKDYLKRICLSFMTHFARRQITAMFDRIIKKSR
jgi:hypothetical protein